MASITSLSNSSYNMNSIYGNRNVLSGLASGMDTESMIENAVSGIKLKIQNLVKKRTKVEWQQEAYRSIIDKAVNFNTKYTSYSSKTNLLSASFFNNAVNTAVNGTYKDKITASGKTSSDIKINAVKQMATAATYTVSGLGGLGGDVSSITGKKFDITKDLDVNTMSGSLTFQYGGTNGTTFDIKFDELENLNEVKVFNADGSEKTDATNAEKLAQAIQNKLGEISYSYTKNGFQETTTADKAIKVTANADGRLTFTDGLGNGNAVKISSSSGEIKKYAGENVLTVDSNLTKNVKAYNYLSDKTLGITFNGTTKTIDLGDVIKATDVSEGANSNKSFEEALQTELNNAFGKGKVTVSYQPGEVGEDGKPMGKLSFKTEGEGDTLSLGGSAIEALGFESGDSNFVNPGKKLSDILGEDHEFFQNNRLAAVGSVNTDKLVDEAGNRVKKAEDGNYYRVNSDNKFLYNFEVNGTSIAVNEDTTLESLMNSINSSAEAGVKVSYSKLTNEFKFTATETGANGGIKFRGLAQNLFGDPQNSGVTVKSDTKLSDLLGTGLSGKFEVKVGGETLSVGRDDNSDVGGTVYWLNQKIQENANLKAQGVKASFDYDKNTFVFKDQDGKELDFEYGAGMAQSFANVVKDKYVKGQDAIMDVTINGKNFANLTRSSNSFDIDGLTINVKGTFNADGADAPDKDGNEYEAITFNTTTDSDKIVDVIRQFVDDYNEMATEIKNQYSTLPAQNSNGAKYEPLTAEEEEKYSESELAAYNEKAKQGILFGDSDLSSMYSKLLSAIAPGGADGQSLREIGIGTSYSNGMTTLSLDEDKLRAALESDPDKVKNAFTKTKEGGSSSDGLMQRMQNTLNTYVKTTGEPKGVLIQRAGSIKAYTSLNNNSLKSQIDNIDSQIDRWQNKMASQIDRYTTQFSRLEQLIAEMNSQSSAFMGLMGGSSGY